MNPRIVHYQRASNGPQRQTVALAQAGRKIPFTKCKFCEEVSLYHMYESSYVGYTYWCYGCGGKDDQVV